MTQDTHLHNDAATPTARTLVLRRRIRWIVAATISYNAIEAVIAITAGSMASSAALIGFGLDSLVEVLSAAAIAWQFAARDPETREKTALRLIAVSFFALAIYVTIDAGLSLTGITTSAAHSPLGIVLTAMSLLIMPFLSILERRTGTELGSASAIADSKQTLICAYLSAAVLIGLLLSSLLGWAWADAVAALVVVVFAIREGIEAWKGESCTVPVSTLTGEREPADVDSADPDGLGRTKEPDQAGFSFTEAISIDAPATTVWATLVDIEGWWLASNPEHDSIDRLDDGNDVTIGARFRIREKIAGVPGTGIGVVTHLDPGTSVTWTADRMRYRLLARTITLGESVTWMVAPDGPASSRLSAHVTAQFPAGAKGKILRLVFTQLLRGIDRDRSHARTELEYLRRILDRP
jgi:hypothetical protein